jgi:hypothetical protein
MQTHSIYLNASGAGWVELVGVGIDFGVQYLTAKGENKKNQELLERMAELDAQEAEKLKKLISDSATEVAKTAVIIQFLNESEIKKLEDKSKKDRILPYIGLGFGVILLSLIFYKLNKQSTNG